MGVSAGGGGVRPPGTDAGSGRVSGTSGIGGIGSTRLRFTIVPPPVTEPVYSFQISWICSGTRPRECGRGCSRRRARRDPARTRRAPSRSAPARAAKNLPPLRLRANRGVRRFLQRLLQVPHHGLEVLDPFGTDRVEQQARLGGEGPREQDSGRRGRSRRGRHGYRLQPAARRAPARPRGRHDLRRRHAWCGGRLRPQNARVHDKTATRVNTTRIDLRLPENTKSHER